MLARSVPCRPLRLAFACIPAGPPAVASSKALSVQPAALKGRITALGKALGPPWSQDEKFAAIGAWITLAR